MIKMTKYIKSAMLLLLIMNIVACNRHEGDGHDGHQTINAKLSQKSIDSIQYNVSTDEYLQDINKVLAELPDTDKSFYIPERSSMIKSFPCSNCHSKSLKELEKLGEEEMKKAHWNIKLKHASAEVMDCKTCHNENNLDELVSITDKSISINHSYQQCGQCHSNQYKDWQGGAHGKRLGGWAPPKVINSCVNCHNPHSPAFASKWPARLNTVKLKEQSSD